MKNASQFNRKDIPKSWRIVPFWSLFKRTKKTGFAQEELLSVYRDYGVIPKSSRDDNHNKESEDLSRYQLVTEGSLVTNKMKAWQGSIAISRHRGIVSPAYYVYIPLSSESDQYIHYLLRSDPYIALYKQISKGVRINQWDLEHEALRKISIPLPDFQTQNAIANFLDKETNRIDLLIEKKITLIKLLNEKRSSTISNLVSKGVVTTNNFKNSEEDWIGKIPSHWDIKRLDNFFNFRNEKNSPIKTETVLSLSIANGITVYSDENRVGGNKRKDDLSSYKIAHKGDIVLNSMNVIVGAVGRSNYYGAISPVYYSLYPKNKDVFVPYFAAIFTNNGFQKSLLRFGKGILMKISGTGQMNTIRMKISQNDLKKVQFPVPPIEEQKAIVSYIEKENTKIDTLITKTKNALILLKEYRSSLITNAVNGQIDISTFKSFYHAKSN